MQLRDYQIEAVQAFEAFYRSNPNGRPLLVLPTGSGKSIILAALAKEEPGRTLILAHRANLLQQNCEKVIRFWPEASVGIYSATLELRQLGRRVTLAGIASVYKRAADLGKIGLVLIDEAQRIPPDNEGMYRTLLAELVGQNPRLRIGGLTATPYRMGSGLLTEPGGLFTDICYEVPVRELIERGYLSRLKSKTPRTQADLSEVKLKGGEFDAAQMEAAFDQKALTERAVEEVFAYCRDRRSWIVFCSGVDHARHVHAEVKGRGVSAELVIGDTPSLFRDQHYRDFRSGKLQCLVTVEVLTEGADFPNVDAVILLRATQSTGLFVQMVGRGLRMAEGKTDCLVLDFGGNLVRHGPIDSIVISRRRNPLTGKDEAAVNKAPTKTCPDCHETVILSAQWCTGCGQEFPKVLPSSPSHDATASEAPVLNEPKMYDVRTVDYKRHCKVGGIDSMKATYFIGETWSVSEWVCFEHGGFPRRKADAWWRGHGGEEPPPESVEEALRRVGELGMPERVKVVKEGRYDRVLGIWFGEKEDPSDEIFEKYGINI